MAALMTLEEIANYLRVTKKTIYRLLEKRDIPATKVGRQWRFNQASIDDWLNQNSADNTADILVIDDDEELCTLFEDTLEELGHTVTTTSEPSRGLELVKSNNYDMVFLDLKMPRMDGTELFKQIRAIKPYLLVIIITGYPDSDLMMNALIHGPLGIMNKPFNSSEIVTAINNYLRLGKQNK
ncbi:response regulator [Chloroflexota bacterium]